MCARGRCDAGLVYTFPVSLKQSVHQVIFEADTPAGRLFDIALIVFILFSVAVVLLDSIESVHIVHGDLLYRIERVFTVVFTIEYLLRLWCIQNSVLYARSFYGVVDLLGILPTYLSLVITGAQYMLVIRVLRVLRVFRVLRLVRYVNEASVLTEALKASRRKITMFLFTVLTMVVVFGSLMYLVEGPANGFTSIPKSIYWAVVTLTTVGYGDISPATPLGRFVASIVMIMGYAIIAVPTGIVTMELSEASRRSANTRSCSHCSAEGHQREATYCWRCGSHLFGQGTPSD